MTTDNPTDTHPTRPNATSPTSHTRSAPTTRRDLIDILHDIAQGGYKDAHQVRPHHRLRYSLFERGFGKCPKQSPATGSNQDPDHAPQPTTPTRAPATDNNDPALQTDDTNPGSRHPDRRVFEPVPRPPTQCPHPHSSFPRKACPRAPTRGRESRVVRHL